MIYPIQALIYTGWVAKEVFTGALTVGADALTSGKGATPMIVEYPLQCTTDFEITAMASSITITPGTITVGIAPSTGPAPATLFVHSMYGKTPEEVLEGLRDMERRLLKVTRKEAAS
ncbi:Na+/H+ antiporter subunit E [Ornithinimicrobium sp. INDO-MA30-4]|uniref:Na+/H+ antiporter subunit E n=1 Tax=Ornithinimicrobium sp. INDO-MA30-4 TaxID=2908651 RepID=UPI001F1FBEBF|nr:Na+/H+ antiporter subunit E [Ornithinimicrobium sp. INDO-MA30-4]UJH70428.1 Na+/H+ antiporter subunit E [Ornithinimicrobium sp. INDO-MA30-4]